MCCENEQKLKFSLTKKIDRRTFCEKGYRKVTLYISLKMPAMYQTMPYTKQCRSVYSGLVAASAVK